ncbi:MAG: hypothetical protein JO015_02980 [Verrucomicrobia bacterium]|nr:hypothetical protein [Verrucomicrobiota bacterium]
MEETFRCKGPERIADLVVQGLEKAPSLSAHHRFSLPERCPAESWPAEPESEDLLRYALATLPAFNAFKSVVGQLGGVLLLYATCARNRMELATLEAAKMRFEEGLSALKARKVPPCATRHAFLLNAVAAELQTVLAHLSKIPDQPLARDAATGLTRRLKAAHSNLLKASDDRFGMVTVNFQQGCCACGKSPGRFPKSREG